MELIWWLVTGVMVILALLPIYGKIGLAFPFYYQNILIIVIAVTFMRYIFLLKHHWVANYRWAKVLLIFIPVPVFFFLIGAFYDFQAFSDEKGMMSILTSIPFSEQTKLAKYIRTEMVLFWTAAILANLYMPIRMIISIWREINKGTH